MFLYRALLAAFIWVIGTEAKHKVTELHFYMHDISGVWNSTAIPVTNATTATGFGQAKVFDDKLTEGSSINSRQLGRGQGIYIADSLSEVSLLLSFTAVFPNGTISFHGQDPVFHSVREISVTGGTGVFRFRTGYATFSTHSVNGLSAVLRFHVYMKK